MLAVVGLGYIGLPTVVSSAAGGLESSVRRRTSQTRCRMRGALPGAGTAGRIIIKMATNDLVIGRLTPVCSMRRDRDTCDRHCSGQLIPCPMRAA